MTTSIIDVIETLDGHTQQIGMRIVSNSMLAKSIGAIRQHIREMNSFTRNEAEDPAVGLDQRNEQDQDNSADIKAVFGFQETVPAIRRATIFAGVYSYANERADTMAATRWDAPLSPEQMLEFMINNTNPLSDQFLQQLSNASGIDPKTLRTFHELQEKQEREQLISQRTEILSELDGLLIKESALSADELSVLDHHQLGIKVVEGLNKAKVTVLNRAMRTRSIMDLGSIPLIDAAIESVIEWVKAYEMKHNSELREAHEAGRNIRTLDEVTRL